MVEDTDSGSQKFAIKITNEHFKVSEFQLHSASCTILLVSMHKPSINHDVMCHSSYQYIFENAENVENGVNWTTLIRALIWC